jgi:hypothetical protein
MNISNTPEKSIVKLGSTNKVLYSRGKLSPVEREAPKVKFKSVKDLYDIFTKELLGKMFKNPLGKKLRLKEGHFFKLIAGGNNKGIIAKAKGPKDAIKMIKDLFLFSLKT